MFRRNNVHGLKYKSDRQQIKWEQYALVSLLVSTDYDSALKIHSQTSESATSSIIAIFNRIFLIIRE